MPEHRTFSPEHGGAPQDVRDAVRARLEIERAAELAFLRRMIKAWYQTREIADYKTAYVNADDVAMIYDSAIAAGEFQPANRAFLGQVFKTPGWVKTGLMVKSRQPKNHARLLHCWKYEG
jgi:hypothetical protein